MIFVPDTITTIILYLILGAGASSSMQRFHAHLLRRHDGRGQLVTHPHPPAFSPARRPALPSRQRTRRAANTRSGHRALVCEQNKNTHTPNGQHTIRRESRVELHAVKLASPASKKKT